MLYGILSVALLPHEKLGGLLYRLLGKVHLELFLLALVPSRDHLLRDERRTDQELLVFVNLGEGELLVFVEVHEILFYSGELDEADGLDSEIVLFLINQKLDCPHSVVCICSSLFKACLFDISFSTTYARTGSGVGFC